MERRNPGLLQGNPFKLGLFGANCSGGLAFTTLPERWDATWAHNVALARMADSAGLECLVPVARWKGFGGSTDVNATTFETITWATGLLANTRRITVFGTVHVQMIHPILAAKQMATADHVGGGRLGVNIVCGWNKDEFDMFNVEQYEHDRRYAFGDEWWRIINLVWTSDAPVNHEGRFFKLPALKGSPAPLGDRAPVMMNAGASPAGRDFAIRNSDLHFDYCRTPEESAERVAETKRMAREKGRSVHVWIPASVVCRPTRKEADDYARHCVENADWEALDRQYELYAKETGSLSRSTEENRELRQRDQARAVLGYGGSYAIRGDPDDVAQQFKRLHDAGFGGAALGLVNYLDELPYFINEVLPRLEAMGLRRPAAHAAAAI